MTLVARNTILQQKVDALQGQVDHPTEQNAQLTEQNKRLQQENAVFVQRVSDLECRLGLNSSNSGKPPSSDCLGVTKKLLPPDIFL